jgi:DNA polymerase sigma
MKFVFNCLNNYLRSKLVRYNFKLYPYGSSTEFLSDRESDIDLFLDLSEIETKEKKNIFFISINALH